MRLPRSASLRRVYTSGAALLVGLLAGSALAQVEQVPDSNLKLALDGALQASDGAVAFLVREAGQKVDLDGDGQTNDRVLHLFRTSGSTTVDTRSALSGGQPIALGERMLAFLSSERTAGSDLNGDGDLDDLVVQAIDLASGETKNLALAGVSELKGGKPALVVSGGRAVFAVSEQAQGNTDLNGDGDTDDVVLHQFDLDSGETKNRVQAIASMQLAGDVLAFGVPEEAQGRTDLNGDGDLRDTVLHVVALDRDITTNTVRVADAFEIHGSLVTFAVDERDQGSDLDGDGKLSGSVLQVFNAERGRTTSLGRAVGDRMQAAGELVAFALSEKEQGEDLNGDGDTSDSVVQLFDAQRDRITSTGLAMAAGDEPFELSDQLLAVRVSERAQGNQDLNQDGDTSDEILEVVQPGRQPTNLALALAKRDAFEVSGRAVVFLVSEKADANFDRNNDGDTSDDILHVWRGSGRAMSTDLQAESVQLLGDHAAFLVDEAKQGRTDLNGDGDANDRVVHVLDVTSSDPALPLMASESAPQLSGNVVGFLVSESHEKGMDLDGDGDRADDVLHIFDLRRKTTANFGRATSAFALGRNVVAFSVPEAQQGMDLNGDGDRSDQVVHAIEFETTDD